jgi:hypothetical protein
MTERFLAPLNRYFDQLLPSHSIISKKSGQSQLKPFQADQFLRFLKANGPQLQFRSTFKTRGDPAREFYTQFLKCGNFATWLRLRTNQAQKEIRERYIRMLCDTNVIQMVSSSREVETVDLLVQFQEALNLAQNDEEMQNSMDIEKLQLQIDTIIQTLPDDLRTSLEH